MPQFYLRGFASNEQIATIKLPGDTRFLQPVRKAASENHFYTVQGHDAGPDVFEKALSEVEASASRIFDKVTGGAWPLEPPERSELAAFIALQAVRGPEQRRNMEHLAAQITRLEVGYGGRSGVAAWARATHGVEISDAQAEVIWDQATQPDGPPIRLAPEAHIQQIAELVQELHRFLIGRPWMLVEFDKRSLITSDNPVGLIPRPEDDGFMGAGFMTAWGITYPITRKLGLLMSDPMVIADHAPVEYVWEGNLDHRQQGTTSHEKLFNRMTTGAASIWLYHHPDDERFVPTNLPEPNPISLRMTGGPDQFTGDPLFEAGADGAS